MQILQFQSFKNILLILIHRQKKFLKNLAETLYRWADIHLLEGYEKMATAHHGPELFIGFLPRYIDVFPEEKRSKSLILEAAEYIGNWKK